MKNSVKYVNSDLGPDQRGLFPEGKVATASTRPFTSISGRGYE